MKLNPAPAELPPLENSELPRPELRLVIGGGEGVPDAHDSERPDLYVVPDPEEEHPAAEDFGDEVPTIRQRVAKRAGKIVRIVSSSTAESERTTSSASEQRYRGSGGGWMIREHLKKLVAKEQHESGCDCHYCAA